MLPFVHQRRVHRVPSNTLLEPLGVTGVTVIFNRI